MAKCRICRQYWRHLVKHHGYADPSRRCAPDRHRQTSSSSAAMTQSHARETPRRQAPSPSASTTTTNSDSEQSEEYEHLEYTIRGPPPAIQYCRDLEKYCHWGNEVKLYRHHVNKLYAMFPRKIPDIKYYVCTINKTFAQQGQRMVHYSKENLKKYIKPDDDLLKVKLANRNLHTNCCIMLGTDKRETITRNWSEFRRCASIHEGDICAFRFSLTAEHRLTLIIHVL
ncbi:hypothetical protein ACQJBY_009551 [Aegilops geniculata]